MRRFAFISICGILAFSVIQCSNNQSSSLRVDVSVASTVTEGIAKRVESDPVLLRALATAVNINLPANNGMVSFTPASMKVHILSSNVFSEWGQHANGEWVGGGAEIEVDVNQWIELVGKSRTDLLSTNTVDVEKENFGEYVGVKVLLKDTALLSGTLTVNGLTVSFTNKAIPFGFTGVQYRLPEGQSIHVDEETSAAIELIFDAEHCATISRSKNYPNVSISDSFSVAIGNPALVPYVGSDTPVLKRFRLSLAGTPGGDSATYYVQATALFNQSGTLLNAAWYPVYRNYVGMTLGSFMIGSPSVARVVQNTDGTWDIGTDYRWFKKPAMHSDIRLMNLLVVNGHTGSGWLRGPNDSIPITFRVSNVQ
jgi:hypothetical protein